MPKMSGIFGKGPTVLSHKDFHFEKSFAFREIIPSLKELEGRK